MKIVNKTAWETKCLKKIFSRCMVEINKTDRKVITKVYVNHHKGQHWVGGHAHYGGSTLTMLLPNPERGTTARKVADTFIHEVGHCLNIRHNKNNDTIEHYYKEFMDKEFVDEKYPMLVKVVKPKAKVDIQELRYERAKNNLEKALTRFGRARTILKKWQGKVKRYELVFANKRKEQDNV